MDRILGFDGQARADSAAALNFLFWRAEAGELLYARPEFAALREFPWPRAKFTPAFAAALLEEAEQAAAAQIKAAGDIDQPLGTMFRIAFGKADEPLGGTSIHANGRPDRSARIVPDFDSTLRAFESRPDKDGRMRAYRGSQGMRLVVFGPTAQSWSLRAFGQQMDPGGSACRRPGEPDQPAAVQADVARQGRAAEEPGIHEDAGCAGLAVNGVEFTASDFFGPDGMPTRAEHGPGLGYSVSLRAEQAIRPQRPHRPGMTRNGPCPRQE